MPRLRREGPDPDDFLPLPRDTFDVLVSLADGYECVDWGGVSHTGGGSHGALSRGDSLAPLLFVGCGPRRPARNPQWALRDIPAVILDHFGVGRRKLFG